MAVRQDGYINTIINGWGTGWTGRSRVPSLMVDLRAADNLYTTNGLAQRVIDLPAEEALRGGWEIKAAEEELSHDERRKLASVLEDIRATQTLTQALSWNRLFGGAAVLIIADDGATLEEPLDLSRVSHIERLDVYSPEDISFTQQMMYDDPLSPGYGKPQWYNIVGLWGNSFLVHESRLILFHGGPITNYYRRMRNGWGGTVFERVQEEISHYNSGLHYAAMALGRLSQGILKLENLSDLLMNTQGEQAVQTRLHVIDMARSLMNTIAIDTADEYDIKNLSLAGVKEVIEQFQYGLCAATGIPATKLFGRAPTGENATGEADLENYYNLVAILQNNDLRPALIQLIETVAACSEYNISLPQEWTLHFESLWNESKREEAETEKLEAEAAAKRAATVQLLTEAQLLDQQEARAALMEDFDIDSGLDKALLRRGDEA